MNAILVGLLFSTAALNTKPAPVFADVSIGGRGPYRFLVDTGAQTSFISPKLAAELRLTPQFRVEIITQHSTEPFPALKTTSLAVAGRSLPETELVFHDVSEAQRLDRTVQGLLGLNALAGMNFTISPANNRLDITSSRPTGEVVPFHSVEDRIAINAKMGAETLTLLLDSGSTHTVLFRIPAAMAKTPPISAIITTIEGARSTVPTTWTAEMVFTDRLHVPSVPAAVVGRTGTQASGLLPAALFKTIYVDQERKELVLVR